MKFAVILSIKLLGTLRIAQQVTSRMIGSLGSAHFADVSNMLNTAYGGGSSLVSKADIEAMTHVIATELPDKDIACLKN